MSLRRWLLPAVTLREHSFYARPLTADSVVVDLGANLGDFSRMVRDRFGCHCYAVEASPDLFRRIPEDDRIRKYHFAIAGAEEPVTLKLSDDIESSSIYQEPIRFTQEIMVPGITLEGFLKLAGPERVDLLKVDIEGAEITMIHSTPGSVVRNIRQITLELHDFVEHWEVTQETEQALSRLRELGFYGIRFRSRGLNCDILFLNRAHFSLFECIYVRLVGRSTLGIIRLLARTKRSLQKRIGLRR